MKRLSQILLAVALLMGQGFAATTNQLQQWGITWQFDAAYEYGTFANGDYWVVGPVTVTNMTPAWDGTNNGWEINPTYQLNHGFTTNIAFYTNTLRPELPFNVTNASLVKTIGGTTNDNVSKVRVAAVLTVLTNAPPTDGTNYFRPPYVGTNKPLYLVSSLLTNLLPSFAGTPSAPTLATVKSNFNKCLRMDHHASVPRWFRPIDAMKDYQPENTQILNESMLRLCLNDSYADKREALIYFTQHALDHAYVAHLGYRRNDDGHNPNHRVLAAWAAVLLDITDIKTTLASATGFHEDYYLFNGTNNTVLWGEAASEFAYWDYVANDNGGRSNKDPYNYIDGGRLTSVGASYQNITSQSLKGQALIFRLFPQLQVCIPSAQWNTLNTYAARWVRMGVWASPDPAAPYDGVWANYGVTFGPNGGGSYIAGSGRFPQYHGANKDGGQYKSTFVAEMWDAYFPPSSHVLSGTITTSGGVTIR